MGFKNINSLETCKVIDKKKETSWKKTAIILKKLTTR